MIICRTGVIINAIADTHVSSHMASAMCSRCKLTMDGVCLINNQFVFQVPVLPPTHRSMCAIGGRN